MHNQREALAIVTKQFVVHLKTTQLLGSAVISQTTANRKENSKDKSEMQEIIAYRLWTFKREKNPEMPILKERSRYVYEYFQTFGIQMQGSKEDYI